MAALVRLRQIVHREMNAVQSSAGNIQIAGGFSPARQQNGIELALQIFYRNRMSNMSVGYKLHSFGFHLLQAPVHDVLFHLEFRDAVAKQAANAVSLLVNRNPVSSAIQLLRGGKPCRT